MLDESPLFMFFFLSSFFFFFCSFHQLGGFVLEFYVSLDLRANPSEIDYYRFVLNKVSEVDYDKVIPPPPRYFSFSTLLTFFLGPQNTGVWGEGTCSSADLEKSRDGKYLPDKDPRPFADYIRCPETRIPLERLVQHYRLLNNQNEAVRVREVRKLFFSSLEPTISLSSFLIINE